LRIAISSLVLLVLRYRTEAARVRAWVVRSGLQARFESTALDAGLVIIGREDIRDPSPLTDAEAVRDFVEHT
jgi:hypothetical protein